MWYVDVEMWILLQYSGSAEKRQRDHLAFAVVVGTANDLAMGHVRSLLATTLAVHFPHFVVTFDGIAAHLLTVLLFVNFL